MQFIPSDVAHEIADSVHLLTLYDNIPPPTTAPPIKASANQDLELLPDLASALTVIRDKAANALMMMLVFLVLEFRIGVLL